MSAQSLFFFTFHKCASVFFGRFVLRRARGLEQVDHAHRMFFDPTTAIEFAPRGHLYGPLRLSAQGAVLERLIVPALQRARGDDVRTCLMVRDPRDMLVSQFFHSRDGKPIRPGLAAAETKERERSGDYKRSGATGDHRRKLAPETVTALTERFGPFLRAFGCLPR